MIEVFIMTFIGISISGAYGIKRLFFQYGRKVEQLDPMNTDEDIADAKLIYSSS